MQRSFPQAAIVDLDGTLVDTLGDFTAALGQAFVTLGQPALQADQVQGLIGKGSEYLVRRALQAVGAPAALYPRAWAAYQAAYREINGRHATVYPGAREGLAGLRDAGLRLACVTNKPTEFARALLAATGLAASFEVVFGGDAFARKKPDPLPLLEACRALAAPPERTLAVGDSINDAEAARAAGCPLVLVTYGYNHGEPARAVPADHHVDRIDQIVPWLRQSAA